MFVWLELEKGEEYPASPSSPLPLLPLKGSTHELEDFSTERGGSGLKK